MAQFGRITAVALRAGYTSTLRRDEMRVGTTAERDRAILELWDFGWSIDAIAAELTIGTHLVEQAVALFGGDIQ